MADGTTIEWTRGADGKKGATWNPIKARKTDPSTAEPLIGWHCVPVSDGCRGCYASDINRRLGTKLPYKASHTRDVEIFLDEEALLKPLRWRRPRRVFVCSMTDLFADFVSDDMIDRVFAVMALCPQHTFQVLTKRPERMRAYMAPYCQRRADGLGNAVLALGYDGPIEILRWPLPNVWFGTSVEDQKTADARIPELLATPAAVRWISAEPLLGPVDLTRLRIAPTHHTIVDGLRGYELERGGRTSLDWVVCGGESGPNARPMHPDWARSLRDQCKAAGVPFLMKQWGEWLPLGWEHHDSKILLTSAGKIVEKADADMNRDFPGQGLIEIARVGKKAAGRLLDGRTWDEFPEVRT